MRPSSGTRRSGRATMSNNVRPVDEASPARLADSHPETPRSHRLRRRLMETWSPVATPARPLCLCPGRDPTASRSSARPGRPQWMRAAMAPPTRTRSRRTGARRPSATGPPDSEPVRLQRRAAERWVADATAQLCTACLTALRTPRLVRQLGLGPDAGPTLESGGRRIGPRGEPRHWSGRARREAADPPQGSLTLVETGGVSTRPGA